MNTKYQVCKPLKPDEYKALEKSILEIGVQYPVELDENGDIVDGHYRWEICQKHELECPTVTRSYGSELEKVRRARMLNMARRHMAPHDWGLMFKAELESRGVSRKRGPRGTEVNSATVAELSKELGVSDRTARDRVRKADQYEALPEREKKAVDNGKKSLSKAAQDSGTKKPKPGSVTFDFRKMEKHYGQLVRDVDDLNRAYPNRRLQDAMHKKLGDLLDDFKAWRKAAR